MQSQSLSNTAAKSNDEPRAIAVRFFEQFERAWNRADGAGFAVPFAEDADFVNIRGDLFHGRVEIARGHDMIFSTIYKGSSVRLEVVDARFVTADCLVFHGRSTLEVPAGPFQGTMSSTQTLLAVRRDGTAKAGESAWEIAAFHNTVRQ
ncbi:MAG: SgcJ/EcaC family oxidoreductase [Polyangiaceae bacterium]